MMNQFNQTVADLIADPETADVTLVHSNIPKHPGRAGDVTWRASILIKGELTGRKRSNRMGNYPDQSKGYSCHESEPYPSIASAVDCVVLCAEHGAAVVS